MQLNDFTQLFKSLCEPVRLRILYLLLERQELCVCDIVTALELPQSVVSRHLAQLRNSGLATARREGVWMYYQLADNNGFIAQLLDSLRHHGHTATVLKHDVARLKCATSSGDC